ncbi:transcriptional regulator [Streptomyces pacificus]|uniref:Transcriptional regulator n=1 Tax=Streptomyces pacificus TaxID=2705029 RepID=A0A6A0AQU4_9ACTN|nr:transcriptional regulator [Streptomyces pacificus]GFH35028.1 transcriptional regulator [Streptomyces pacificus]
MEEREAQRIGFPLTIPDILIESEAMRSACATRNFGEIFRLVNRRTGSSYAAMAAAVGSMTSSRVSDIIRGVRGIRGRAVIERVCDGFGIPGEMLGVSERPWERGSPSNADEHPSSSHRLVAVQDRESKDRLHHADENPHALDLLTVSSLRQEIQDLDVRYAIEPSVVLIAEVGRHLGRLAHWQQYSTTYSVRRDLHAAVIETSTLMGQLIWDASGRAEHVVARDYFLQAASRARELRDPVSEGLALLRISFVALYGEKEPGAGLALTQKAAETVKGSSDAIAGLAVLHSAEAYAMKRQRRECERALSQAESYLSRVHRSDAGASMLSPGQFSRLAGSCFLALNQTDRAQTALEQTVLEVRQGSKSQAITLGNLALAYLRQNKAEEAVHALSKAIGVVEANRGGGGLNLIFQAGRELQPWQHLTAVQENNDRLFSLIAAG